MTILDYRLDKNGQWNALHSDPIEIDGEVIDERDWRTCDITDVPLDNLLNEYECLLVELGIKEVNLSKLKEEYNNKEFEIVYISDIDFKSLYGSTAEKVRKHHAETELKGLNDEINRLELSISWIKMYIALLREVIRCKQ